MVLFRQLLRRLLDADRDADFSKALEMGEMRSLSLFLGMVVDFGKGSADEDARDRRDC